MTNEAFHHALASVPTDARTVFLLHAKHALSLPDVAEALGADTETVTRLLAQALRQIAARFEPS